MPYINFWEIGIEQIDDTVERLLAAIDQIKPMAAGYLDQIEKKDMSNEEQEWFDDYASDQGYMAQEAIATGKQIIPVVIQSYLENWLNTIWKGTRKTVLPNGPTNKSVVDRILLGLGISTIDIPKLPGYTDAIECWQVANAVKHADGKAKVDVTLVGGKIVPAGNEIDYSQLRFGDYSKSVVLLLTEVAKYASQTSGKRAQP